MTSRRLAWSASKCTLTGALLLGAPARAGDAVEPWRHDAETHCMTQLVETATLEDLLFHASRYGDTSEKKLRKEEAYSELERRGAPAFSYLVANAHRENMWFYLYARRMLPALPNEESVDVLKVHLGNPEPRVRRIAAFLLGFCEPLGSTAPLRAMLADEEAAGAALRTLGKWKDREAVDEIVRFLADGKESRRIQAAVALGEIGELSALTPLIHSLDDGCFTVRNAVAEALADFPSEHVGERLLAVFDSLSGRGRRQALRLFGELRYAPAAPLLRECIAGETDWLGDDARRALAALSGEPGPEREETREGDAGGQ